MNSLRYIEVFIYYDAANFLLRTYEASLRSFVVISSRKSFRRCSKGKITLLFSTTDALHVGLCRRISSQEGECHCGTSIIDTSDEFTVTFFSFLRSSNSWYYFFIPDNDNGDPFANNSGMTFLYLPEKRIGDRWNDPVEVRSDKGRIPNKGIHT